MSKREEIPTQKVTIEIDEWLYHKLESYYCEKIPLDQNISNAIYNYIEKNQHTHLIHLIEPKNKYERYIRDHIKIMEEYWSTGGFNDKESRLFLRRFRIEHEDKLEQDTINKMFDLEEKIMFGDK